MITYFSRNHIRWVTVALTMAAALAWANAASAQTPLSTKGFSLEGHVAIASADAGLVVRGDEGADVDPGRFTRAGGGASVAYGFSEWFSVFLTGDGHQWDEERYLVHGDIGARFHLPRVIGVRPHAELALTGRRVTFEGGPQTIDTRGTGVTVGGGVLAGLSTSLAVDIGVRYTFGDAKRFEDGVRVRGARDVAVNATRVSVGIRWFPGR